MCKIHPVLLAGGTGTRLWPISRKSYPKQFSKLIGGQTLFQQSALRLTSSEIVEFAPHITLTNSDFRFIVGEQLQAIGIVPGAILIEPEVKNTAPAILAASVFAMKNDPDAILLVAPSDHVIPDIETFHLTVQTGLDQVRNGKLVTFGITPTHPETGYGYLELLNLNGIEPEVAVVSQFVEKPDLKNAECMLKSGNYLWNAGIFLFRAQDMVAAFEKLDPVMLNLVQAAVAEAKIDLGFLRLNPQPWANIISESIDYAIMEKADNLVAVAYTSKWSDLGGWDAVWAETVKDEKGNAVSDAAHAIDCENSLLRAENPSQQLVGVGLENIIAISMRDAVLVANKDRAQDVKKVVHLLKKNAIPQAESFPKDHRPWGWFESLILSDCFHVKRIFVNPGGVLSLQSHKFRSEHWVVVEGVAKVTIDDQVKSVEAGHSVYVPLGAIHRMENPGLEPMVLIEVQIGSYFGEDDIVRYEDFYARS
ncbi:mannose-1-phosphate guanylyltransferase/mannose-6-phosphate isomerase [Planktomarina temperata]|nr:mannose-1-phosphate guanylyltransferase/mannose-6-phosphate isomerase [Planktomarina temperata]MDB2460769.1 mannose-1-phosphate guanylyltransferase/mannose-6-phosphate isomerase [Planktomarina temperata]